MEARKKTPRGFKKEAQGGQVSPLNPLYVAPWVPHPLRDAVELIDRVRDRAEVVAVARKVSGRPRRCKLAHAFLWGITGNTGIKG
jgi:hypothetical protein